MAKLASDKKFHKLNLRDLKPCWSEKPRSKSENEKKQFLSEYPEIAEIVGVHYTVELLLPNLIEAFYCYEEEDHEVYGKFAELLFSNLSKLIDFLGDEGQHARSAILKKEWSEVKDSGSEEQDGGEDSYTGYYGLTVMIFEEVFTHFFSADYDRAIQGEQIEVMIQNFVKLVSYFSDDDKEERVIPFVLDFLQDEKEDEQRYISVLLIDALAETLGADLVKENLLYELISLQDDSAFKVRKELVFRLVNLGPVLGE